MNKPSRIAEALRLDLTHRPRRNRKAEWARRLVSEHVLTRRVQTRGSTASLITA